MADDRDYGYPDISQEPIPYDCTYDKADGIFRSYKFSLRIDPKLWLWQDGGMFTYDGQTWILDISVYPSERYDRLYETASRRGRVDFGGLGFQEYYIISEKKYAIDDVRCYCCEKKVLTQLFNKTEGYSFEYLYKGDDFAVYIHAQPSSAEGITQEMRRVLDDVINSVNFE